MLLYIVIHKKTEIILADSYNRITKYDLTITKGGTVNDIF